MTISLLAGAARNAPWYVVAMLCAAVVACTASPDTSGKDNDTDPDASETPALSDDDALAAAGWSGRGARAPYRPLADSLVRGGVVLGTVALTVETSGDSAITPTHDLDVCHPFTETHLPSQNGGVGNAVVWLVGVTSGPRVRAPKRASLTLDRCQLSPRVQVLGAGGTLQVVSRDAMLARLRFVGMGGPPTLRAQVETNDAGQVVPTEQVGALPGLVAVRDDLHPWVRGYVVVTSHPFVDVTNADGSFRFEGVPPGRYTLAVWQERLGVRRRVVRVTRGVETRVRVEY